MKRSKSKAKIIIILFAAAIAAGGLYFYTQYSNGGVVLEVEAPEDEVEVGVPFDIQVIFTNDTGNTLGNVRVSLDYPSNIVSAEDGSSNIETRELGDISDGRVHKETFRVVATPSEKPDYEARLTASYSPAALVAEFKKSKDVEIRVKSPDFELDLESPEAVFFGEEFDIKASYEIDDEIPELAEFEIHIDYPPAFEVISSDPEEVDRANDGVRFKEIDRDEGKGDASVRGRIELPDNSDFQIKARLVMRIFGEEYTFATETRNVFVEPSPLIFQVSLAEREEVIKPGERVVYALMYRNNTEVDLRDLVVTAQLLGDMFDIGTLDTDAKFSGFNNTLTWDSSRFDQLDRLEAGQSGQLLFAINLLDTHPVRRLNDKNFTVVVSARIQSPTVPYLIDTAKTTNTSRLESKVAGKIEVNALALFRDAQSGIVNTGPFPPQSRTPTNYTIHWQLTNYGTDVDEVEVRARLGSGVSFTGVAKGNTSSAPKIDQSTGEIVWRVGKLLATTGILSERPEAIFQVEAVPQSSHVGEYMVLVEETRVQARDEFTDTAITGSDSTLDTRLADDSTVGGDDGRVVN